MTRVLLLTSNGGLPKDTIVDAEQKYDNVYEFVNAYGSDDTVWIVDDKDNPLDDFWAGYILNDDDSDPAETDTRNVSGLVEHPNHYNAVEGMPEVWDILDAFFPDDPDLWNAGKYLLRAGRKDGVAQELGKLIQYVERRISKEDNDAQKS